MSQIAEVAARMKLESPVMAATPVEVRNNALLRIKDALLANQDEIFAANAQDLEAAERDGVAPAVVKRLLFNEHKLADVCAGIDGLVGLPDPVDRVLLRRELDEGLVLERVSVPIGVIGVIFEARPDALVQISTLCLKSGNCAILKGGSETMRTNKALFDVIYAAATEAGLPDACLFQAEAREEISELLGCYGLVDLLIPRGSNAFVRYIMENTKIPVMGHADGICHIYVDKAADVDLAVRVCVDAKIQYTAACNAVETLLVDRAIAPAFLPAAVAALEAEGVEVRGDAETCAIVNVKPATDEDWDTEYLALIVSIKLVDGVDEAIEHINRHGSHHTDAIMTNDPATAERFMRLVDSAGVYQNCSTRFADGFRYGLGAEVGISTSKLHARGPVGLEGLVTYKYKLYGSGQIVGDYATGKASFHFRDFV
ncbi:MAG: glutamate-5-semialdehyde dehydrogenase [Atopobiaceae bacterium]|nr:glutamate-5-semialdehyde dehydrogenase [Atopobiaceae bacterium]